MDLTAADSIFGNPAVCRLEEAPMMQSGGFTTGVVPFTTGIDPTVRPLLPGYDSGIVSLIIITFLLLAFNLSHYTTMIKSLPRDLFSTRRRDSLFEEHTLTETRLQVSMVLVLCLCEGMLLAALADYHPIIPFGGLFVTLLLFFGAALLFYVAQLMAYRTVGFIFSDKITTRLWLKGFSASQIVLGLTLVIPALTVTFDPATTAVMVTIAVILYIVTRLIFIYKGFRLFYDKFGSIVYFILYLCTLEVVPILLMVRFYIFIA
ncbi:MAG: DUF4271 domain-containing protein [Lachnoclostridium sp.]|nr:DUF4271 domain-containing protein [Lachnoclostridium sp.]